MRMSGKLLVITGEEANTFFNNFLQQKVVAASERKIHEHSIYKDAKKSVMETYNQLEEQMVEISKKLLSKVEESSGLVYGILLVPDALKSFYKKGHSLLILTMEESWLILPVNMQSNGFFLLHNGKLPLSPDLLKRIIPALSSEPLLKEIKRLINNGVDDSVEKMKTRFGTYTNAPSQPGGAMTQHAREQWVRRIRGLNDSYHIAQLLVQYKEDVEEDIREAFAKARLVWKQPSEKAGGGEAHFYLNEEALIVFVVMDMVIITLYQLHFGFTPEINRMIVLEQLKLLEKLQTELGAAEGKQRNNYELKQELAELTVDRFKLEEDRFKLEEELAQVNQRIAAIEVEVVGVPGEVEEKKLAVFTESEKLFSRKSLGIPASGTENGASLNGGAASSIMVLGKLSEGSALQ